MKILVLGATGMVGRGVLLEALDDPEVADVLALGRGKTGETHPKLRELQHADLFHLAPIQAQLKGYDACVFCLGVSSVGMSEPDYARVTFDLTLAVATAFLAANPGANFVYVSGQGTDSTETGNSMWARVKGRTENALLAMPFGAATMMRPGIIQPQRGIRSKTGWYRAFYAAMRPFTGMLVRGGSGTTTTLMGLAMLEAAGHPPATRHLETKDINELAQTRLRRQKRA